VRWLRSGSGGGEGESHMPKLLLDNTGNGKGVASMRQLRSGSGDGERESDMLK